MERLTRRNEFGEVTVSGKDNFEIERKYHNMANCLAELEDKLASGQLLELPCSVGDFVYAVKKRDDYFIEETKATGFIIKKEEIRVLSEVPEYPLALCGTYLTLEEAKTRMKELQNGKV